ncbi:MAG TPA: sigma-70 family RNA polymerase sigma factor [Polyangiaceae bacterium]
MSTSNSGARVLGLSEQVHHGEASTAPDVPAFESIYAQYFRFVWASSFRLGVESSAVDDVVQEIFMVVYAKLPTLRQPASLRSWIYGIVRRTVSDHRRSLKARADSAGTLAFQVERQYVPPRTPMDLKEQSDQVKLLWALLEKIPWPQREVFMLAELEELTVPEIAEALQIPLNTAYSRLRAARIAFEEGLARRTARGEGRA